MRFEHSVLRVLEIYALENAVFYIVVYGPYKLIIIRNTKRSNAPEINCSSSCELSSIHHGITVLVESIRITVWVEVIHTMVTPIYGQENPGGLFLS